MNTSSNPSHSWPNKETWNNKSIYPSIYWYPFSTSNHILVFQVRELVLPAALRMESRGAWHEAWLVVCRGGWAGASSWAWQWACLTRTWGGLWSRAWGSCRAPPWPRSPSARRLKSVLQIYIGSLLHFNEDKTASRTGIVWREDAKSIVLGAK